VLGIIDRFMVPGEILLDPYAGWGTSLIAANLLGMEWVGFEIEPDRQKIAMQRLQQRPVDLQAFGVDAEPAECERDPAPGQKDTSKQAAIEICKVVKTRKTAPDDPSPGARAVELVSPCLVCEAMARCMRHDPHAGCLNEFKDFEKCIEDARADEPKKEKIPNAVWCESRECDRFDLKAETCTTGSMSLPIAGMHYCPVEKEKTNAPFIQHCCGTCGHHKGRKTFHESCPRLGELLFKGGTKSAKVLMEETQREQCEVWISKAERIPNITWCSTIRNCPALDWESGICTTTGKKLTDQNYCPTQHLIGKQEKEYPEDQRRGGGRPSIAHCPDTCKQRAIVDERKQGGDRDQGRCKETGQKHREMQTCPHDPPKKKTSSKPKPKPYTIYIKRSDGEHPFIVSCDSQGHGGTSNPCDTQEEVIKRALVTLDGFVHDVKKSTLSKKPLPVTGETTLFIDKTGLFTRADFFDQHGEPKKPEPKKSASKKSKTKESENP
jgi:hypothetical protein